MSEKIPNYEGEKLNPEGQSRRAFIGGLAALVSAGVAGPAVSEKVEKIEELKLDALLDRILEEEPATDMSGSSIETEMAKKSLEVFLLEVRNDYENELTYRFGDKANLPQLLNGRIETLRNMLEVSLDEHDVLYNRDADSLYDSVINDRLQCRSGTYLFLYLAAKILSPEDQKSLIIIYTDGHMLPGYAIENGEDSNEYYGLEMTAKVASYSSIIPSSDTTKKMRIVKAAEAVKANLTGKADTDTDVLFESYSLSNEGNLGKRTVTNSDLNRSIIGEYYGFGKSDVTAGDKERPDVDSMKYGEKGPVGHKGRQTE